MSVLSVNYFARYVAEYGGRAQHGSFEVLCQTLFLSIYVCEGWDQYIYAKHGARAREKYSNYPNVVSGSWLYSACFF